MGPNWGNSNIDNANDIHLGGVLIVQENNTGCHTGVCTDPDDEGSRPNAGSINFEFDYSISSFGFDLIDVEGPEEYGDDSGFFALLLGQDGQEVSRIGFGSFVDDGINNAVYGNNSLNRIQEINLSAYSNIYGVELNFGGSAAIDNIAYTNTPSEVPEPSTIALFALIGGAFAFRRKLRK